MKKILFALLAGLSLSSSAFAMDGETLISHPERYRVVYADAHETAYVDMESLFGQQTMDYPSSLENVSFTLYVETYKDAPDPFDFENGTLISSIREFKVDISADKRENHYTMDHALLAKYDAKGAALPCYESVKEIPAASRIPGDAKGLYLRIKR